MNCGLRRAPAGSRGLTIYAGIVLLGVSMAAPVVAQVLPDTAANRARGVVGCTQTSSGIQCPNPSSGSSYSTYDPMGDALVTALTPMFQQMGEALGQALFGFMLPPSPEEQARRQQQIIEQQRRVDAARRQREEEERRRRAEWNAKKQALMGQMRGVGQGSLGGPRTTLDGLTVVEKTGAFGTRYLARESISSQPRQLPGKRAMTALERAACSHEYLAAANRILADKSYGGTSRYAEAASISREAGLIMTGQAAPSGSCGQLPQDIPKIPDPVIVGQQVLIMSALMTRAAEQTEQYSIASQALGQAENAEADAEAKVEEDRVRVEELEAEIEAAEAEAARARFAEPGEPVGGLLEEPVNDKKSAMEEALKALEESEEALEWATGLVDERQADADQMLEDLKATGSLAEKAQNEPDSYGDVMQELGIEGPPKGG